MSEKSEQNVTKNVTIKLLEIPEYDTEWKCYLFSGTKFIYVPLKGAVPNWFVRWMMKICLGCRWERNRNP